MTKEIPFEPFPMFQDPHYQTILNSLFNFFFEPTSEKKQVCLPGGDRLSLEVTTPKDWKEDGLTVLLVHGLCGSHKSPNLVRMVNRLEPMGIRTVRFNMRGCGSGKGLAREIYHSGRSEDVFEAIKALKKEYPASPIVVIGFSLGGNIVLKMAGELGSLADPWIQGVISVSPPVDLYSSVLMLGDEMNSMYERYFYRILRAEVYYRHRKFKDLGPVSLPKNLKLHEFDQLYVAPQCGFESVSEYYSRCSAVNYISDIAVPTKILMAQDDPIVSSYSLDDLPLPEVVDLFKTKKGGHMGYLGDPRHEKGVRWLDALLVDWILGM